MSRQLVHLTEERDEALNVGRRHASNPTLLVVDAAEMLQNGYRITKRGKSVYTTQQVPPAYLTESTGEKE